MLLARAAACQTQHYDSEACLPGCLQIVRWGTSLPALHEQNNQDVVWAEEAAKKLVTRAIVDLQSALGSSWAEVSSSYTAEQMPSFFNKVMLRAACLLTLLAPVCQPQATLWRNASLQVIGETEACAQKFKGKQTYNPIHLKSILNRMQKVRTQERTGWQQACWPHAACLAHMLHGS